MVLICATCLPGAASARSSWIFGGTSQGGYVHSSGILLESEDHDAAMFRVGGILGHRLLRPGLELESALFAGALLSSAEDFNSPAACVDLAQTWRATKRLVLSASLVGELEPLSVDSSARSQAAYGALTLALAPEVQADLELDGRHQLTTELMAESLVLFKDPNDLDEDTVTSAAGVQAQIGVERSLATKHALAGRIIGRLMTANTRRRDLPLDTGLIGGLVGTVHTFRDDWLRVEAMVGAGTVLNQEQPSHLWPVEPLAEVEAHLRAARLDAITMAYRLRVKENTYYVGFPERLMVAELAWTRPPSHRCWYARTAVRYEHSRYGLPTCGNQPCPGSGVPRDAETLHTGRARARLGWRLAGPWHLHAAGELALGGRTLHFTPVGAEPPTTRGVFLHLLAGVAYLHAQDSRDLRLLDEVW